MGAETLVEQQAAHLKEKSMAIPFVGDEIKRPWLKRSIRYMQNTTDHMGIDPIAMDMQDRTRAITTNAIAPTALQSTTSPCFDQRRELSESKIHQFITDGGTADTGSRFIH